MKKPGENRLLTRNNRVYIEMANSAKKFWQALKARGIDESNYKSKATETGIALVELITTWHRKGATLKGGDTVDLDKSFYLTLSWNSIGSYQLHQFPLYFTDPRSLSWRFPENQSHLCGFDATGDMLWEWYAEAGGQLKYFPLSESATWKSPIFRLEPLPSSEEIEYGIIAKVKEYFPKQWAATNEIEPH